MPTGPQNRWQGYAENATTDEGTKITILRNYTKRTSSLRKEEVLFNGAGYGIQTRGLNFGKVACYHYTIPAQNLLTKGIISDKQPVVKHFLRRASPSFYLSLSEPSVLCNTILALGAVQYRRTPLK